MSVQWHAFANWIKKEVGRNMERALDVFLRTLIVIVFIMAAVTDIVISIFYWVVTGERWRWRVLSFLDNKTDSWYESSLSKYR